MTPRRRARRPLAPLALLAAVAVLAAACGGDDDAAPTTTATVAPSTTTPRTTTTPAPTTTTEAPGPVFPLTGLPVTDVLTSLRRALVVKLDNHPEARPQTGLAQADIVFEENVEQLTRFAAVFHSQAPEIAGPVRSGRTQDINLLSSLNKPILAWSGGNGAVTAAINASSLVNMSALVAPGYFRSSDRRAPHNLYVRLVDLWNAAPEELSAPPPLFTYAEDPADAASGGSDTAGAKLSMDGVRVAWAYDPASQRFLRLQADSPHTDETGAQLAAANVVVAFVQYLPSPADRNSPEAQTVGEGPVWVYSQGRLVTGTWSRTDLMAPWVLTDAAGDPISLAPGATWVELARDGKAVDVPAGTDLGAIGYP